MKIKLFRIISLLFVFANLLNIAVVTQPAHADAATDGQAVGIIAACKDFIGPVSGNSDCNKYRTCSQNGGGDNVCQAIKQLDPAVPSLNKQDTVSKCIALNQTASDCKSAWANCIASHIKDSKISGTDAKACSDLVAQGKLADANKPPDNGNKTSCVIEAIGWIICPVVSFLAKIVDAAYGFVSSLLTVQPLLTTGQTQGVYEAWSLMRNFANVAFVIAFLIIIFSQVSSIGITNYGIKKMLPRLIVSAILVNVSYWVCAVAIDISNILGTSITDLFQSLKASLSTPDPGTFGTTASGWGGIAEGILSGTLVTAAALYIGLSALLPALIAALLAIVTVFLVLTLRQALIILLVVVAPLAFVAYLLPNTEPIYKKWRELGETLLIMYPLISIIFGSSALASKVVMGTATGDYKIAIQIMGALISIIPLAITPIVLKTSHALLSRFGGAINNPNKGPFDRMRKGAVGYRKNRQTLRQNRSLNGGGQVRVPFTNKTVGVKLPLYRAGIRAGIRRNAVNAGREGGLKDAQTRYIAQQALAEDGKLATQMASGSKFVIANERAKAAVMASAISQEKKAFQEDVSNMEALVKIRFDKPEEALAQAIEKGDKTMAVAAQNILIKSGGSGVSKFRETIQNSESAATTNPDVQAGLDQVSESLRANIQDNHGQYTKQKGADIVNWASSVPGTNGKKATLTSSFSGPLSDNDLAGQHAGSLGKMVNNNRISRGQATRILNDPRVSANLDKDQRAHLEKAATSGPNTP